MRPSHRDDTGTKPTNMEFPVPTPDHQHMEALETLHELGPFQLSAKEREKGKIKL